jgi:DNA repair exonuclease SbcCD ATPase subunit
MSERKEPGLNLSGLDVDTSDAVPAGRPAAAQPSPVVEKPRGGSLLLTLILLLLAAGGAGLGYWTAGLKQTLDQQQAALTQAQARLAEMEQLLELTSDSASQAGQTLMGRIGQLESQANDKYAHFDSEIAKLWTVSYQRNKPQLEEQKKALEAQQAELSELKQQLASDSKRVAALSGRVDKLAGLEQQLATLDKALNSLQKALSEQASELQKVSSDAGFALSLEKDERVAADRALDGRIEQLAQRATSGSDLASRIATIEQSIQAIDGSRRQFNQSLLQLREQVAQLQRRLGG